MTLQFEWDPRKAAANLAKHKVSFEEERLALLGTPFVDEATRFALSVPSCHAKRAKEL